MVDPVLHWMIGCCLVALWGVAFLGKWREMESFRQALRAYRLLPESLVPMVGWSLAGLELCVAIALLVPRSQPLAAMMSALLLIVYALAMGLNLARGRSHFDCGCNPVTKQTVSWFLVWRNSGLAILSLALFLPIAYRDWGLADLLITSLVSIFICLAYFLIPQIISNMSSLEQGAK